MDVSLIMSLFAVSLLCCMIIIPWLRRRVLGGWVGNIGMNGLDGRRMVGWWESGNDNWNNTCWTSLGFTSE